MLAAMLLVYLHLNIPVSFHLLRSNTGHLSYLYTFYTLK